MKGGEKDDYLWNITVKDRRLPVMSLSPPGAALIGDVIIEEGASIWFGASAAG